MEKSVQELVAEFMDKHGQFQIESPSLEIPQSVKELRYRLIREEVEETFEAMGFTNYEDKGYYFNGNENLTEIADGLADIVYVVVGTAIAYGIPFDRIFQEVHRSNMTKDAVKVADGQKYGSKTPKGLSFVAPDIEGILLNADDENHETRLESLA